MTSVIILTVVGLALLLAAILLPGYLAVRSLRAGERADDENRKRTLASFGLT